MGMLISVRWTTVSHFFSIYPQIKFRLHENFWNVMAGYGDWKPGNAIRVHKMACSSGCDGFTVVYSSN